MTGRVLGRRGGWRRDVPHRTVASVIGCGLLLSACGVGAGTVRIAEAERVITAAVERIVTDLQLQIGAEVAPLPREQCMLRAGGPGLRSRISVRALAPSPVEDFERAATALVAEGFLIVDSGVPGVVLGQRDGMSITLAAAAGVLEVDALTGCRPQ
jgi:hypothetical protein